MFKPEKSLKAWFYRFLLGPAMILDGMLFTISFTIIKTSFTLNCARKLSAERFKNALL